MPNGLVRVSWAPASNAACRSGSVGPGQQQDGGVGVWVPKTRPPHATWAYSWISPPTRSSLTTGTSAAEVG
jgi:hypothetical protein